MHLYRRLSIFPAIILLLLMSRVLYAQDGKSIPAAEEILQLVRYSQSTEDQVFNGEIRPRKIGLKATPIRMEFFPKGVRFVFFEGNSRRNKVDQVLELKLLNGRYELTEFTGSGSGKIAPGRYSERIRGSDFFYEDIAMRFLYWPEPKHLKVEKAKGGAAWKIRCNNPDGKGPYSIVDVWVSQESGTLVRMNGFDSKGRLIKSYEVESVQRYKGSWILKMMNVRSHPTTAEGRVGSTFLKLELPD